MAHRALYLRYRPKKFAEVKGQQHVVKAIQSAVIEARVGHAYLLHGPRGTGKTTIARLLAKALNCVGSASGDGEGLSSGDSAGGRGASRVDSVPGSGSDNVPQGDLAVSGEPCGVCDSCVSFEENRSFDLHELDAASNNKVDDMRALLERVNLVTPGRAKVYLLDEVHMLTTGAENALLKTLEEPPDHVTWVMATTEPHKVAETIRSRCQVFELGLLSAGLMAEHVRYVAGDAGLDIGDDVIDHVVSVGGGSVRDTLSALDSVVPGAEIERLDSTAEDIFTAITGRDPAAALEAVDNAMGRGRSPRTIGESVLVGLRNGFLCKMGVTLPRMSERESRQAEGIADQLTAAAMTQAMETLGQALVDMRQAPDPRVDIEVAMVKLCQWGEKSETDEKSEINEMRRRVAQLESRLEEVKDQLNRTESRSTGDAGPQTDASRTRGRSIQDASPDRPVASRASSVPSRPPPGVSVSSEAGVSGVRSAQVPPSVPSRLPPPPAADPTRMRPRTPTEVVTLAEQHLNLAKELVVKRAKAMLPPKAPGQQHRPEDLLRLWRQLIAMSQGIEADDSSDDRSAERAFRVSAGKSGKSGQSGKSGGSDKSGKSDRSGKSGGSGKSGKSGGYGKSDKSGKSGGYGKSDRSGKSGGSDRSDRSGEESYVGLDSASAGVQPGGEASGRLLGTAGESGSLAVGESSNESGETVQQSGRPGAPDPDIEGVIAQAFPGTVFVDRLH